MDALIEAAQAKVNDSIVAVYNYPAPAAHRKQLIARAIHSVDALKSALKAIQ
ncbi:hypothetical protein LCGC14_2345560 [marine sediment metagenome]|uniref:Uncharacterized protein n=1 Tax=marine sediment metagenome TaxID=412755 RepID=A0A0F9F5U3_9ZZZZ